MADWYIDIGTTKVCSLLADVSDRTHIQVFGVGSTSSEGLHKGQVEDPDKVSDSIRRSLEDAWRGSGITWPKVAYASVTGKHLSSANNSWMLDIKHPVGLITPREEQQVIEQAKSATIGRGREPLHYITRHYLLDNEVRLKSLPQRLRASKLGAEVHIITAQISPLKALMSCLLDVEISGMRLLAKDLNFVANSLASAEAVVTEEEREAGVVVADIGGGTTDIAVFREGEVWYTFVLPVGGYQFTNDIARGLGIHYSVAEQLKMRHGNVNPDYTFPEGRERQPIPLQDLHRILKARVEELLEMIVAEVPVADYRTALPGGLVLTGGSANLAGMAELGQQALRIPVRVGKPILEGIYGIKDPLGDPSFATAVGLLRWKTNFEDRVGAMIRVSPSQEVPLEAKGIIEERPKPKGILGRVVGFFRGIGRFLTGRRRSAP